VEHRLILGGYQYLPYARSRIKALRALGKEYATEPLVFPDASGSVRISGEHSFIRIVGAGQTLEMDSGVVDLTTGFAGKRRETFSTESYLADYVLGTTAGAWSGWRTNPTAAPAGQAIGAVSFPPAEGHIRDDLTRAPSFEPKREAVSPATDPPTWEYSSTDEALTTKRNTATTTGCPPSIFTGRTRLYVQAMYGRPLHRYASDVSIEPLTEPVGVPTLVPGAPPALSLPAYRAAGDDSTYSPVVISTSSGVHWDADTGAHWLMNVNGGHLDVYPLRSSAAGEALRRYMVSEELSETDREKIEAYVLAYSLPDVSRMVSLPLGAVVGSYAMGYGWHWNWSGTAADIVFLSTFDQGGGNKAMLSTHMRISVNWGDSLSASADVIEGPTQWSVYRLWWCITEPEWGTGGSVKTTPRFSSTFSCNAPFYCFYKRDELQLCRVSVADVPATGSAREMTTGFATSAAYGALVEGYTAGLRTGYCEDRQPTSAHLSAVFSCGAFATPSLILGNVVTGARWEVSDKSVVVQPMPPTPEPVWSGRYTIYHGYVPYDRLDINSPNAIALSYDTPPVVQFTWRTYNFVRTENSLVEITVPFYDSEAIFMRGTNIATTVKTSERVRVYKSSAYGTAMSWYQFFMTEASIVLGERIGPYIAWITGGIGGTLVSDTSPPTETIVDESATQALVTKAGATASDMGELPSFHLDDQEQASSFGVLSSASVPGTVVMAGSAADPVGVSQNYSSPAVLVGWV